MNIQNKEDLLGLIKKEVLHCPNCGAEFEMNNDKYKLINLNKKNVEFALMLKTDKNHP
jgi:hypothetical protein